MPAHHPKTQPFVVANARHSPGYGCALRLDRARFGALLGHARILSASEAGSIATLICDAGERFDDTLFAPGWVAASRLGAAAAVQGSDNRPAP